MQARRLPDTNETPIQLSLRVRHPAIDPDEISAALGLEPEHCFKAGDLRTANAEQGRTGQHLQTYWLAPVIIGSWGNPIEPTFLAAIVAKSANPNVVVSAERLRAANKNLKLWGIEVVLLSVLRRLNVHHSFLQRIQSEGGDVSLLLVLERASAPDFTLPLSIARLLVQLGIAIDFKFDS